MPTKPRLKAVPPQKGPKGTEPSAPSHLSTRAKAFWTEIVSTYLLEAGQLEILRRACEEIGRADEANVVLREDGPFVTDRFGQLREHPAIAVERQAHLAIARLLRELNLDVSVPDSRPPTMKYGG